MEKTLFLCRFSLSPADPEHFLALTLAAQTAPQIRMNDHLPGNQWAQRRALRGKQASQSCDIGQTHFSTHTAGRPSFGPLHLTSDLRRPPLHPPPTHHAPGRTQQKNPLTHHRRPAFLWVVLAAHRITLPRGKQNGWGSLTGPETPEQFHLVLIHGLSKC